MDSILSQESLQINCLAVYNVLPHMPADLVLLALPEIGRHTFSMLEHHLFLKLTNNKSRFHSPSRISKESPQLVKNSNLMRTKQHEKMSLRYEEMKRNDQILELEVIEHFWQRMRDLS